MDRNREGSPVNPAFLLPVKAGLRGAGGYPLGLIIGLTKYALQSQRKAEQPYADYSIGGMLSGQLLSR
jgi:hypothetical protein